MLITDHRLNCFGSPIAKKIKINLGLLVNVLSNTE